MPSTRIDLYGAPMSRAPALVALAWCALTGCSQSVLVKTDAPLARVWLDGRLVGNVGPQGVVVEVAPGSGDLAYEVEANAETAGAQGNIARDQAVPWTIVAGAGAAAVCVPVFTGVAVLLANPGAVAGSLLPEPSLHGGLGALARPSPWTLPFAIVGATIGLAPLGLAFVAEGVDDEVMLHVPPRPKPAAPDAEAAQPGDGPPTPSDGVEPQGDAPSTAPLADELEVHG
jgi:hypothetical protein